MNNSLYNFGAALLDSVDIFGKYFLNAVDAPLGHRAVAGQDGEPGGSAAYQGAGGAAREPAGRCDKAGQERRAPLAADVDTADPGRRRRLQHASSSATASAARSPRRRASLRRGLAAHELPPDPGGDEQAAGAGSLAARTNPEVASGPGSSEIGWVSCSRTATCRWFS